MIAETASRAVSVFEIILLRNGLILVDFVISRKDDDCMLEAIIS